MSPAALKSVTSALYQSFPGAQSGRLPFGCLHFKIRRFVARSSSEPSADAISFEDISQRRRVEEVFEGKSCFVLAKASWNLPSTSVEEHVSGLSSSIAWGKFGDKLRFFKFDADRNCPLTRKLKIRSLPTVVHVHDGEVDYHRALSGSLSKNKVEISFQDFLSRAEKKITFSEDASYSPWRTLGKSSWPPLLPEHQLVNYCDFPENILKSLRSFQFHGVDAYAKILNESTHPNFFPFEDLNFGKKNNEPEKFQRINSAREFAHEDGLVSLAPNQALIQKKLMLLDIQEFSMKETLWMEFVARCLKPRISFVYFSASASTLLYSAGIKHAIFTSQDIDTLSDEVQCLRNGMEDKGFGSTNDARRLHVQHSSLKPEFGEKLETSFANKNILSLARFCQIFSIKEVQFRGICAFEDGNQQAIMKLKEVLSDSRSSDIDGKNLSESNIESLSSYARHFLQTRLHIALAVKHFSIGDHDEAFAHALKAFLIESRGIASNLDESIHPVKISQDLDRIKASQRNPVDAKVSDLESDKFYHVERNLPSKKQQQVIPGIVGALQFYNFRENEEEKEEKKQGESKQPKLSRYDSEQESSKHLTHRTALSDPMPPEDTLDKAAFDDEAKKAAGTPRLWCFQLYRLHGISVVFIKLLISSLGEGSLTVLNFLAQLDSQLYGDESRKVNFIPPRNRRGGKPRMLQGKSGKWQWLGPEWKPSWVSKSAGKSRGRPEWATKLPQI